MSKKVLTFAKQILIKVIVKTLFPVANPIAETPILFDEDARRFEERMKNVKPASAERKARAKAAYEWMKSIATFPF